MVYAVDRSVAMLPPQASDSLIAAAKFTPGANSRLQRLVIRVGAHMTADEVRADARLAFIIPFGLKVPFAAVSQINCAVVYAA